VIGVRNETILSAYLSRIRSLLSAAGVPSPGVESELILTYVLALKRSEIYSRPERIITQAEASALMDLAERRTRRIPLQYLLGECEFMSLPFRIREGVFIPRPETEVLVEAVKARIEASGAPAQRILDIGTGSGVIAVSLARCLEPDLVVGTDISLDALEIARANAILNRVESVSRFVACDRLGALRSGAPVGFDVVVSNPPYVESGEIPGLQPEVRDHEPMVSLDGGPDGLRFFDGLLPGIASILKKGGLVAFEIGETQGPRVKALLEQAGLKKVEIAKDLAGFDRVVLGRRF
jgi:release factor glutamine methyltransferase